MCPAWSLNWNAFVVQSPEPSVTQVLAAWIVPRVALIPALGYNQYDALSTWVDDGYGNDLNDLIQGGTQETADYMHWDNGDNSPFYKYVLWTQCLPDQKSMQADSNFDVYPDDKVVGDVLIQPDSDHAHNDFVFVFRDVTRRTETTIVTKFPDIVAGGVSAEWVMERPLINNSFYWPLAQFPPTLFQLSYYFTSPIYNIYNKIFETAPPGGFVFNVTMRNDNGAHFLPSQIKVLQ